MKFILAYPFSIETKDEALLLEGVGNYIADEIMKVVARRHSSLPVKVTTNNVSTIDRQGEPLFQPSSSSSSSSLQPSPPTSSFLSQNLSDLSLKSIVPITILTLYYKRTYSLPAPPARPILWTIGSNLIYLLFLLAGALGAKQFVINEYDNCMCLVKYNNNLLMI